MHRYACAQIDTHYDSLTHAPAQAQHSCIRTLASVQIRSRERWSPSRAAWILAVVRATQRRWSTPGRPAAVPPPAPQLPVRICSFPPSHAPCCLVSVEGVQGFEAGHTLVAYARTNPERSTHTGMRRAQAHALAHANPHPNCTSPAHTGQVVVLPSPPQPPEDFEMAPPTRHRPVCVSSVGDLPPDPASLCLGPLVPCDVGQGGQRALDPTVRVCERAPGVDWVTPMAPRVRYLVSRSVGEVDGLRMLRDLHFSDMEVLR
jgi:hypothetical protein